MPMDIKAIRNEFPALQQQVYNKPLVYFDNGATTQKPQSVIDALQCFYSLNNANVHRGVHALSQRADKLYEQAREDVRKFINAKHTEEIIFTHGTTEAINLVAYSFSRMGLNPGDEIIITEMEHHANIVPWQVACEQMGATLKVVPMLDSGDLDIKAYQNLLSDKTRLVALVHVSNTLGTINPIEKIIALAHQKNIPVLIDAAQSIHHVPINVQTLDCDFLAFSGHKMYGPTGIGVLYGKKRWLDAMPPYQTGGGMIDEVSFAKTTYASLPYKFEAGTPNIAGAIGLSAAIQFIHNVGFEFIKKHEELLTEHLIESLTKMEDLTLLGSPQNRVALASFTLKDIHAHDVATILDRAGVAVRAGHHCTMPLMRRFGIPASVRASLAVYNTLDEIDVLCKAMVNLKQVFTA